MTPLALLMAIAEAAKDSFDAISDPRLRGLVALAMRPSLAALTDAEIQAEIDAIDDAVEEFDERYQAALEGKE